MNNILNSASSYGYVSKLIHWSMAAIIILLICSGFFMVSLELSELKLNLYRYHKEWGVIAGMLIMVRLIWLGNNIKVEPFKTSKRLMRLHLFVHKMLYFFMIAYPISGVIMVVGSGQSIAMFGYELPLFLEKNIEISMMMKNLHGELGLAFMFVIVSHILINMYHRFVLNDGMLKRIL